MGDTWIEFWAPGCDPGPTLTTEGKWRVNQQVEDLSAYLSIAQAYNEVKQLKKNKNTWNGSYSRGYFWENISCTQLALGFSL